MVEAEPPAPAESTTQVVTSEATSVKIAGPPEIPAEDPDDESEAAIARRETNDLYTVTRIYDGDTIDAFRDGQTIKVRLACIDAAETDQQPHGTVATEQLSTLIAGEVSLTIVDEDRYGRSVAEVYTPDGAYVNRQMVEAGAAVVYDQYLDRCGANADALLAAEEQAQASGVGVWRDPLFVLPWEYRQGVRATAPEPVAIAPEPEPAANLPACVNGDCDCGDFTSWQQAQDVLNAYSGDPHRLDGDNDGEACESLR
ncbi:MAG: thermonuclease family protein [Cyanobacteria bacterium J06636_16]